MFTKRRNAVFGRYPCCDLVNNAIRCILHGDSDSAIEELLQAIIKADGYVHEDLKTICRKHTSVFGRNEYQFKAHPSQLNGHLET